jgi:hypothetical protein
LDEHLKNLLYSMVAAFEKMRWTRWTFKNLLYSMWVPMKKWARNDKKYIYDNCW